MACAYPWLMRVDVHRVRGVRISNAWILVDRQGRRFLVDTGHRLERGGLERGLRRSGVRGPGDLTALLLTHRHSDHAGNAAWVRERYECPVLAHPRDAEILERRAPAPSLASAGARHLHRVLCRIEDAAPARTTVDEPIEAAGRWGFTPWWVGGHTEGSVLLTHEASGTLFSGDAIIAGPPIQRALCRLSLAVPDYSLDVERCRASTLDFLRSEPPVRALCSGHGPLVRRRLTARLARLRRRFGG